MLRKKISELNKQSLNMIPIKVHDEMLQRANDRAHLAERKVSILEQEVKKLRTQRTPPTLPPISTSNTMSAISELPGEGYEEPHRSRHEETYKPPHPSLRLQGVGVMPSVATSSKRDRYRTPKGHIDVHRNAPINGHTNGHHNDLNNHRTNEQHTFVLANGHANSQVSPSRTLPASQFSRGVSVMPSVAPQPVMPSIATVRSTTKNNHFDDYPEPCVFTGSKTFGRSSKQTTNAFRKNNGTVHYLGNVSNGKVERLAAQPKARRRPSVHSLVTQSIVNLDDQREREMEEEEERKRLQAEREEMERLEQERIDILNKENKTTKHKGRFRKTTKASKGGKSFLSRNNTSKPKAAKSGTQKSLLSRMHTKFFTTRRKTLRHIYDLPEVSSLETCSMTSDYETPSQKMQNFSATPLICPNPDKKPLKPRIHPRVKTLKKTGSVRRKPRSKRTFKTVGQDRDSEESDWSSSEDGTTSRSNKHRRSAASKSRDRHRTKTNKATPPPVAPKPKKKNNNRSTSGSSSPPSSPDTTTPDTTPEISFDDIVIEPPQLKTYKRIHGPQGRRRPQRFSNQSEIRSSEIQLETTVLDLS